MKNAINLYNGNSATKHFVMVPVTMRVEIKVHPKVLKGFRLEKEIDPLVHCFTLCSNIIKLRH